MKGDELVITLAAPEIPEGELIPREPHVALRGLRAAATSRSRGRPTTRASSSRPLGDRAVIAHDAKQLGDVPPNLVFDTAVAGYLLDPARRGYPLDELAEERGIGADAGDELATYAVLIHELAKRQRPQIEERGLTDLMNTGRAAARARPARDREERHQARHQAARDRRHAASAPTSSSSSARSGSWPDEEFVIGSPQQLGADPLREAQAQPQAPRQDRLQHRRRVLQAIRDEHPIIPKIERYRELSKLAQTYLDALPNWIGADGRLHTTFEQTTAATGRLCSINPNLQNIPIRTETGREIRACFIAEPGNVLLSVDYGQVELRVLAHIANEQVLRDIFQRGEDVHTETASAVFDLPPEQLDVGMRSKAKMVNYGIVYGLSAYGLADRLQIPQDEAQEFIDRYLERFPAVAQFMKDAVEQAEQHGYVCTLFGRRRQIPEIRARNWQMRSSASGSRSTP